MAKRTYTATLPNGEIAKRTTERTYTHLVAYRLGAAELEASARATDWQKTERSNHAYHARIVAEGAAATAYGEYAEGEPAYRAESRAHSIAYAQAFIADFPTADDYVAHRLQRRLDDATNRAGRWVIAGWCGRPDLAAKLAAKGHYCADRVEIIAVA